MSIEPLNVSIPETARLLGCGRSKVYELINSGEIRVVKLGTRTLVPLFLLRRMIQAKLEEAA